MITKNSKLKKNPEIQKFRDFFCINKCDVQGSYRNPEGLKYNHLLKYLLHLPISLLIVFKYLL